MRNQRMEQSMKAKFPASILISLICVSALSAIATADDGAKCREVSGAIAANLTSGSTAQGTVTGGLRGSVTASFSTTPQSNGNIALSLHHVFVTESGDTLTTQDNGLLVPVPDSPGVYRMTVQYMITGGAGRFAGASGALMNHGEAVLNSTPAQLTLRYAGHVCTAK
jgi:hypothetical protein